jgi:hypothetical protein
MGVPTTKGDITLNLGGANCMLEGSVIIFLSNSAGIGSSVVVTDIDLWIAVELNINADPITFVSTPGIATNYGYREFGQPGPITATTTNIIDLTTALTGSDVLEVIII